MGCRDKSTQWKAAGACKVVTEGCQRGCYRAILDQRTDLGPLNVVDLSLLIGPALGVSKSGRPGSGLPRLDLLSVVTKVRRDVS